MLYIITVTLNPGAHIKAQFDALSALPNTLPIRWVVVDQGSTDGTVEWLMGLSTPGPDPVRLVPGPIAVMQNIVNTGAAAGWNAGLRFALQNGATAMLVCGHDTVPMPGTIERLLAHITSGLMFVTGTAVPMGHDAAVTAPSPAPDDALVAAPDFSFFVLTPMAIEAIARADAEREFARQRADQGALPHQSPWDWGLFDSSFYPAYFEDNDYHWRARAAGVACVRDPKALFRHDASYTIRRHPQLGRMNEQSFAKNAERFKQKWGHLPSELPFTQARPLNVTDAQWAQMTGGRVVQELDPADVRAQAQQVYDRYRIS